MNNNIIQTLKKRNYIVPSYILNNYKDLNINYDAFILLIYFINQDDPIVVNYNKIAKLLNANNKEIMISIEELKTKKIIEINLNENKDNKYEEIISLEPLYNKIFMGLIEVEQEQINQDLFSKFEEEFGRTLSPIEYELISGWEENGYSKEIIVEALRESILNGVTNLKYIDKILIEWDKKGIKNINQIKKYKENYSKNKNIEIPEFDWVNDEENN